MKTMENSEKIQHATIDPGQLRKIREDNKIKLSQAARELGIERQRLFAYERGKDRVPADILLRMVLLYRTPIEDFSQKILPELSCAT
jgi:transcriptional regulator with XRE-family HTH domain